MKTKLLLLLLVSCVIAAPVAAQQEPQFQQNMFNHLTVNPGYAGSNGAICTSALYRKQWVGFIGAPSTFLLNIEAPVSFLKGGVGATIVSDELGLQTSLFMKFSYAYRTSVGPGELGIGISAGFVNNSLDG
ncbi:MAG: PorP/SprF family type IX secretion system membrane protein, partial [Flavobacteriales bacterium]|nr:PorP/SprF family type IX secretion system membrane protein [Flavobacteriales bacterium]